MGRVVIVQHVTQETPGTLVQALANMAVDVHMVHIHNGERIPTSIAGMDGLVVMGGPMSVCEADRSPHLRDEMRLTRLAVEAGRPVLGICLGSQLLAAALGATVRAGPRKEIGWHMVTLSEAADRDALFAGIKREFEAFHWHGDVFDLPPGAVSLPRRLPRRTRRSGGDSPHTGCCFISK